jgi:hypothetical protein
MKINLKYGLYAIGGAAIAFYIVRKGLQCYERFLFKMLAECDELNNYQSSSEFRNLK